jgi:hypothetical protein
MHIKGTVSRDRCQDEPIEQQFRPKLMFANPFSFKNRPFKSYGPESSAPIDVKTGSSDPADFAATRHLIHW